MTAEDKYQIKTKAKYLKLLLLKNDLEHFHNTLQVSADDGDSWIAKLRNTRQVFLVLNNVRDTVQHMGIVGPEEYVALTKKLRKMLSFINHFRNKAIGHLDTDMIERAAQWAPFLFSVKIRDNERLQIMLGHRAVIEAGINSFLDEEGVQKIFKTEIDLMYPPDRDMFYEFLCEVVTTSIEWLAISLSIVSSKINYHDNEKMKEMSVIAGKTEFDLRKESNFDYSEAELKEALRNVVSKLKELGTKQEIIDLIEKIGQ